MPHDLPTDLTTGLPTRILVLTDAAEVAPELLEAMTSRAADGDVRFRLVVLNPARAEVHLLHPERHDPMDAVEETLNAELVQEIWLHVREHALTRRVHQDLTHRLSVHHLPVRVVEHLAGSVVRHR